MTATIAGYIKLIVVSFRAPGRQPGGRGSGVVARAAGTLADLPLLGRAGLVVIGLGLILDAIHHVATRSSSMHVECCGVGFVGHVSTILGMLLVTSGVLALALRPRRPARPEKGGNT